LNSLFPLLALASLLICFNHCLLFRGFNRARAPGTHLLDGLSGGVASCDQVTGQDGPGAAKTGAAMDGHSQALPKKAINDVDRLFRV
jgi:hypothetical protein